MSLAALIIGVVIAAITRRELPALVGALAVFLATTALLASSAGPAGSDDALTSSFWVIQAVILAVTVVATVATARLRQRQTAS